MGHKGKHHPPKMDPFGSALRCPNTYGRKRSKKPPIRKVGRKTNPDLSLTHCDNPFPPNANWSEENAALFAFER